MAVRGSRAAQASMLNWVLKAQRLPSTFKMAVLCSQAPHLPHFKLYDGRTEFSSSAPAALQL